ncbi:MAG: Flp family type IVb pilin [Selenomonadaceae bacterium]|nr:Flp family type IVb pilin [Selenomonadaceae bacterium]
MIKYIDKLIAKLKASEKGQGMVEYALIIAFVAAIAIVALNNGLGQAIKNAFSGATSMVSSASDLATGYPSNNGGTGNP